MGTVNFDNPIRWTRLEPERQRRTRPGWGVSLQPPPDRALHAGDLLQQAGQALRQVEATQRQYGIDPASLLVLRLTFVGDDLLDILQKLGCFVVEERALHFGHGRANEYRVVVQFSGPRAVERFEAELRCYRDRLVLLSETPQWLRAPLRETAAVARTDLATQLGANQVYQFPSDQHVEVFERSMGSSENRTRFSGVQARDFLTLAERRNLGHALQAVGPLQPDDRLGARLREEGAPDAGPIFLDVDLWHPGDHAAALATIREFDRLVRTRGGRVRDVQQTQSMILARIEAHPGLVADLLNLSVVSRVDLKPVAPVEEQYDVLAPVSAPALPPPPDHCAAAVVIDSGVVSGHGLLAGWVMDSVDFNSGDLTDVDRNGHGTQVAGIVVYGDLADAIRTGRWTPRVKVFSGKVLNEQADFADEKRAETQIRDAIEYFVKEYDCRVFNLSLGNVFNEFDGAHQLPWAHVLDELARRHKLIIVVSAGNVQNPTIPAAPTEEAFRRAVRDQLVNEEHRLIDPATASLALTVGAIARRDDPAPIGTTSGEDRQPAASPRECPAPFTRTGFDFDELGTGISKQIKPELVAYGGNYCLGRRGRNWVRNNRNLGEPTLRFDTAGGRLVSAACGTSFAAPYVTHVAALTEHRLREIDVPVEHRANATRALLVHAAEVGRDTKDWLEEGLSPSDGENRRLRLVGYGRPNEMRAMYSSDRRAVLWAVDHIPIGQVHLYELFIPREFIQERGHRDLRVTLAYDPPTRATRKEYLARTMWFRIIRGLTADEVLGFMSRSDEPGAQPSIPHVHLLSARPSYTHLQWSTVQSSSFDSSSGQAFNYEVGNEVLFHVLVGCQERFPTPDDELWQNYALVASLEHEAEHIRLHQAISQRITERIRLRRRG